MGKNKLRQKWSTNIRAASFGLFLLFTTISHAQDPIPSEQKDFEFLLRGKALSFVAIEDDWTTTASFGTEIRLYDKFSFVADLVYIRRRFEEEVFDQPDPNRYSEYSQLNTRRYLAFELRYFLTRNTSGTNLRPYVNIFNKWGKREWRTEDKFPLKDGELYQLFAPITDWGASFGVTTPASRLGVDFNVGIAYRFETQNTETFQDSGSLLYEYKVNANKVRGNMRLNFYWNFMQKKK
ncbi:MAG: hypothetical protein GQ574_01355 [Crocinitomix sp.]|nr:hypothetical protein [Crocinitomix sp.]